MKTPHALATAFATRTLHLGQCALLLSVSCVLYAGCGGTPIAGAAHHSAESPTEPADSLSSDQSGAAKPTAGEAADAQPTAPEPSSVAAVADSAATGQPDGAQPVGDSYALAQQSSRGAAKPATESTNTPPQAPEARKSASAQSKQPGRIRDLTFDDIKFEMDKEEPFERSMLTPEIEKLVDKPIRIRGYILPASVFSQTGFNRFILVRDNQECCFGPGAALYDAIVVEMEPGKTADYNIFPVAVEGTFSIREMKGPGGRHLAIYHMVASSVK